MADSPVESGGGHLTRQRSADSALGARVLARKLADQFGDHGRRSQRQQMVSAGCGNLLAAGDPGGDVCCAASHHRILLVSDDYCGRYPDLAEPGVCGRVGPLMVAQPEIGIYCSTELLFAA